MAWAEVVRLFNELVSLIKRMVRKKHEKEHQDEVDKLEQNPDVWFDDHFDGLSSKPNDASETSEANPVDNHNKQ